MNDKTKKQTMVQAVRAVLGKKRIAGLSNQAACEVNGGFANILRGSCKMADGMYPGNAKARAAQAAVFVIQACGSKPVKADVEKIVSAVGK